MTVHPSGAVEHTRALFFLLLTQHIKYKYKLRSTKITEKSLSLNVVLTASPKILKKRLRVPIIVPTMSPVCIPIVSAHRSGIVRLKSSTTLLKLNATLIAFKKNIQINCITVTHKQTKQKKAIVFVFVYRLKYVLCYHRLA